MTAHEKSFEYFKGIPKNIIYDQDAVFLYDENIGDYVMTAVFGSYVKSRPFKVMIAAEWMYHPYHFGMYLS